MAKRKKKIKFSKFSLDVFFTKYKRLIDLPLLRKDAEKYMAKVRHVGAKLDKVDFDRNLIILCTKDVMKEVFLSGFCNLETLRSFELLNMVELMDIYMGKWAENSEIVRSSFRIYDSVNDLNQDVLCLTCNYYEAGFNKSASVQDVVVNTIMRRYEYIDNSRRKPLRLSWVFFMGTRTDLEKGFPALYNLFLHHLDHPLFDIVDLNVGDERSIPVKSAEDFTSDDMEWNQF